MESDEVTCSRSTTEQSLHMPPPAAQFPQYFGAFSALKRVFLITFLLAIWSAIVTWLALIYNIGMGIIFVTVISIVISLLLVFRTNTAYDRYWEGRRLWSTITSNIRNIARIVWMQTYVVDSPDPVGDLIQKKSVMNLLLAYAVATKYYLREDYNTNYDDIRYLVNQLPRLGIPASASPKIIKNSQFHGKPASKWKKFRNILLFFLPGRRLQHMLAAGTTRETTLTEINLPSNLPLEITLHISGYLEKQIRRGAITMAAANNFMASMQALIDCLTSLERIRYNPIPLAYSVHLKVSLLIYCLLLPFQIADKLGWWTIMVVWFVSFIMYGVEAIGEEIENPFGYDPNDLPIDSFCDVIRRELNAIQSKPPVDIEDWAFSTNSRPIEGSEKTAAQLRHMAKSEVETLLAREAEEQRARFDPRDQYDRILRSKTYHARESKMSNVSSESISQRKGSASSAPELAVDISSDNVYSSFGTRS
ncbi:uncharacterized protein VTP21DRAFT_6731 [Calcarisporiella thermophila]|uniref:uncharacterized protein n=1 Tax=Calcarisporiella thermophila TaxID=911321 RepID=UPI0037449211